MSVPATPPPVDKKKSTQPKIRFDVFCVLAVPFPRQIDCPYDEVCRTLQHTLHTTLRTKLGHTEPADNMEGIALYLPNKQTMQQVLKLKTVEIMGTTMRLTPLDAKILSPAVSRSILVHDIPLSLTDIYKSLLLNKYFKDVHSGSMDVRYSDIAGITACVTFPPQSLESFEVIRAQLDGTTILGNTISCIILKPKAEDAPLSITKCTIEVKNATTAAAMTELLTTLKLKGFIKVQIVGGQQQGHQQQNENKKKKGNPQQHQQQQQNGGPTAKLFEAQFSSPLSALQCRALLAGKAISHTILNVVIDGIETITPETIHSEGDRYEIFLSGFNTEIEELYESQLKELFERPGKAITVRNIDLRRKTIVVDFPTPLDAGVAHTWRRAHVLGHQLHYEPIPQSLHNAEDGAVPFPYLVRLNVSSELLAHTVMNYIRTLCRGTLGAGGFVSINLPDAPSHHHNDSFTTRRSRHVETKKIKSKEYRVLFHSKTCDDAVTVTKLDGQNVDIGGVAVDVVVSAINEPKRKIVQKRERDDEDDE